MALALGCGAGQGGNDAPAADEAGADAAATAPAEASDAEPSADGSAEETGPAAAGTRRFVNSRDRLTGPRADHYVEFAFRYPAGWRVAQDATTPETPNFVKVESLSDRGTTLESLAVGWFGDPAAARGDPAALRAALAGLEAQLSRGFEGFEKVSESTVTIAGRQARGFRFAFRLPAESEVPRAFGRAVLVPTGGDDGLALMMFATPLAEGIDGPEDVGETGGLATALGSLEIGASPGDGPGTIRPRDLDGGSVPATPLERPDRP